jgi:hypothetical protein
MENLVFTFDRTNVEKHISELTLQKVGAKSKGWIKTCDKTLGYCQNLLSGKKANSKGCFMDVIYDINIHAGYQ